MDGGHEVQLKTVVVAYEPIEIGRWIVRPHDDRAERPGKGFQFRDIARCRAKQEVEIDGRDRRSLQRGRGVANEDRFEIGTLESACDLDEERLRVHSASISVVGYLAGSRPLQLVETR